MYCNKCGNKLEDGMKFCNKCGNKIGENKAENNKVEGTIYNKNIKVEREEKKVTWKRVFVISLIVTVLIAILASITNGAFAGLLGISAAITILLFYFIPTFVAAEKKHRNEGAIGILNFFVGWTFIGWVICLVWALSNQKPIEVSNTNNITNNKYDDLRKLQELKENGIITEEEFEREKRKLLN